MQEARSESMTVPYHTVCSDCWPAHIVWRGHLSIVTMPHEAIENFRPSGGAPEIVLGIASWQRRRLMDEIEAAFARLLASP